MKRKHQKGSGLLNYFRRTRRQAPAAAPAIPLPAVVPASSKRSGFSKFFNRFTRKQPARVVPAQEPLSRPPSARARASTRNLIPHETLLQAIKRIMVFFFKKHFPAEVGRYPANARALTPEDHIRLVREFRKFHSSLPQTNSADANLSKIAREFFYSPSLYEFDREISVEEIGTPDQRKILQEGTPNARISFTACGDLNRCVNHLLSFPRELEYLGNVDLYYSKITPTSDPITTLQSQRPIEIFKSKEQLEHNLVEGGLPVSSYIVIKPEFYKNAGRVYIRADRFIMASFIQDAFEQEGVLAIDPQLVATLEDEVPAFLQKAEIKLATPDQLEDLGVVGGKFMIFEAGTLRYRRTYLYPPAIPQIRQALENRQVLLTDPLTMYILRKDDPELWTECFDDVNMNDYQKLTRIEQLVFCLLQYILIYKRYQENLAQMAPQDALRSAIHLFSLPLNTRDLIPKYLESFRNSNSPEWQSLHELTTKIANRSVNIENMNDLQYLLAKLIEREFVPVQMPTASPAEMNIEGLEDRIERLDATLRSLNDRRRRAAPNSRERRVTTQLIRESMNARRALQKLIQLRQNNTNSFGRTNLRSTRRRIRS